MNSDCIKKDVLASIVVFLVAIPLCIGVATASGFPPLAGLISGIIGGIFVGALAGCPLQVSGPAAGLIVLVIEAVKNYGLEAFGVIVFLAGLIQIIIGTFNLAIWFRAVSPAIIQGMLSGIGVIILSSQLHVMLDDIPTKEPIKDILLIPDAIYKGIFPLDGSSHHLAAMIGILTILILAFWHFTPKKIRVVPAALVAVLASVSVSLLFHLPIKYITISNNLFDTINLLSFKNISNFLNIDIFVTALTFAIIASAETLLSANAVDKMTKKTQTNYNKEILAQGLGNSFAGILGVLPITGVIVRSSVNIEAGAKTRLSAVFHGVWVLLFITLCPFILNYIPSACLAALLVYTGYRLINIPQAKAIFKLSKEEFTIFLITVVSILATNLLEGILVGIVASIIRSMVKLTLFDINLTKGEESGIIRVKVTGNLTFLRLPQLANIIENIEPCGKVVIMFENSSLIDHSIIDLLVGWSNRYIDNGGEVSIDWDYVKKLYPDFGWAACRSISRNLSQTTPPKEYTDCCQCKWN